MLHVHAVLMGAFLALLLVQTLLVATGRQQQHQKLGMAGIALAPALVVVGFLLVPIIHQQLSDAMQTAPAEVQVELQQVMVVLSNIMLLQIQAGILFALYIGMALYLRKSDPGMHKRLIFLAVALPLPAGLDRILWLRTRKVHKAYTVWLAGFLPASVLIYLLWNTDWWQTTAPQLVGL